ncbi:hybrid sensor histidine kinase/response regulator [Sulfitobacter mediterraneus]|nr:hybrid sensor histidine kinase/response regulator [Sulfitobacter mediterraneus]
MTALINEAVKENSPFATTHKNTLRFEHPDLPLNVSADFNRTKQVMANLISNACKYSDPETEVLIKAEQLDGKVIVYIQNRGPGIPENFKPLMFQAFSQADSSDTRAKGGTGLGLNITKQIVSRHQGEIGFESAPDGITVFWFTYPSNDEDDMNDPIAAPNVKRLPRRGKARVLHIEDDLDFAEVVKSGLSKVADVTHAGNLEEARRCIENGNLDMLIVDWSLPDGDAAVLLDDINDRLPNVTVLGLSSDGNRRRDSRVTVNLEKSRTELSTIAEYVSSRVANAS